MKRSQALTPLSHDHHQALAVALRLRKAESVEEARTTFESFWAEQGNAHFRVEEDVLLPMWKRFGSLDRDHLAKVAFEHLEIREAALAASSGELDLEGFGRLGELLQAHVRYEERVLFPLIEGQLSPEQQARVGAAIEEAEADE